MPGINTNILATDYNNIQSKIAGVMGTGSGQTGFGQTLASGQVSQYGKITLAQWNNLRDDIVRCRQHQTGLTIGSTAPGEVGYTVGEDLPIPTNDIRVKENWRSAYLAMATDCEDEGIVIPIKAGHGQRDNLVPEKVRTTPWNGTISQTITVNFGAAGGAGANAARYFFNTGGTIEFSSIFDPATAGLKNVSWATLLSNMGTISFAYNGTTTSGTGSVFSTGWYNLTTTNKLLFQKDTSSPTYVPNKFYIYGKVNSTTDRRIGTFTLYWEDSSTAPPTLPDPGFGVDEDVDGDLSSLVQVYRAIGDVVIPVPSATTTNIA